MKRILSTLFVCTLVSMGFSQTNPTPCTGVTPDFTFESDLPSGGVHFKNTTTNDNQNTLTYHWDFGNGQNSTDKDTFSMYDEGTYNVILTVNGNNCQSVVNKQVTFSYEGK